MKALIQNRRRDPAERRCATSGTVYDAEGRPIGEKGAFQMWRSVPHRIHTHLAGPPTHGHHGERRSAEHSVVARDSLACGEDCWRRSVRSEHCYLNGSTQQYVKDTCPNSKTLQKCGLGVATAGTAGRNLNIGTQRNSGLVLSRSEVAFLFQPKSPLKSGLTLRGPNSVRSTQQMLQQQGIDYARGGQCNVPGRVVPIVHKSAEDSEGDQQAPVLQPLSQRSARQQQKALDTKLHQPPHRLGGMPGSTFANHQRVMANRNGCSDAGPCY